MSLPDTLFLSINFYLQISSATVIWFCFKHSHSCLCCFTGFWSLITISPVLCQISYNCWPCATWLDLILFDQELIWSAPITHNVFSLSHLLLHLNASYSSYLISVIYFILRNYGLSSLTSLQDSAFTAHASMVYCHVPYSNTLSYWGAIW